LQLVVVAGNLAGEGDQVLVPILAHANVFHPSLIEGLMLGVTSGAFVELFAHPDATEITKAMRQMLTLLSAVIIFLSCAPAKPARL